MGAWEVEVEQRIRFLQLHIFGVVADWRVDPFMAVGAGLRQRRPGRTCASPAASACDAWIHPDILGRVDLACLRRWVPRLRDARVPLLTP